MAIDRELADFLAQPHFAKLATINRDGTPQLTVVWYEYDGRDFLVTSFADRQKVRNIRRDDRVTLLIDDRQDPYRVVTVKGRATVTEEGAMEETRRLAIRYHGPEEGERRFATFYSRRPRVLIRIRPERFNLDRLRR